MERVKREFPGKGISAVIGITVFVGVILKIMDNPYGPIVFTVGFLGFFLIKFIKLSKIQRFFWTRLHTFQLIALIFATVSLILLYLNYPYARIAFVLFLLIESLINLRITINKYIGNENFKMILAFLGKLLRR